MSTDNELSIRQSAELTATKDAVREAQEVRAAIQLAREFPRNEEAAYQALMKSCRRTTFALSAVYRFKRGKKEDPATGRYVDNYVEGPSVGMAREFSRLWGNLQYGFTVVREDGDQRTLRGFAWDVETNTRIIQEAVFKKLIQRKVWADNNGRKTSTTEWVEPDERDLRELANKHGAIASRNCVLQVLPKDYIDEAVAECRKTMLDAAAKDPDAAKKAVIKGFGELNIPIEEVEQLLGHGLATCSPAELAELRQIWKAVADGAATWTSFFQDDEGGEGFQGNRNMASKTSTRLTDALNRAKGPAEPKTDTPTPKTEAELVEEARQANDRLVEARRRNGSPEPAMQPVGETLPKVTPQVTVADQSGQTETEPPSKEASSSSHSARAKGGKQQQEPRGVGLNFE